jgi:predicted dehydrogenase
MDQLVSDLRLGVIGFSAGNGHPFSFSAIVNGYDGAAIRAAGWGVIADYLDRQDPVDVGLAGARVAACWAPDPAIAAQIAAAARIERVLPPAEMPGAVDAVIVARDDWRSHAPLAMPFLEAGIPVFVDKPLTLDPAELDAFAPYLDNGLLMSCSGMRYARELDALRADPAAIGRLQLVTGAVVLDFARYGVHLLEAAAGVTGRVPRLVWAREAAGATQAALEDDAGALYAITAMGATAKRFRLSFHGDAGSVETDLADNFSAFRRCMARFLAQVRDGRPAVPPEQTLRLIEALIAVEAAAGRVPGDRGVS